MVPQKASGRGSYTTLQLVNIRGGNFFFSFFLESGVKLDEKSIENGLEGQKFLVVCLFWGGCHHPNIVRASGAGPVSWGREGREAMEGGV